MANYFDSLQDSFDITSAPRFVDFNALDEDDRGNRSAWFDSHESFYADATILMTSPSKKKKKKSKVSKTAKTSDTTQGKPASKVRSTSRARSTALQPVTALADADEKRMRKRAASVRPQREGNREAITAAKEMGKAKITNDDKENVVININSHPVKPPACSPIPEAKQLDLDRIILERLEQNRRARRQASVASAATSAAATTESAVAAPPAPLVESIPPPAPVASHDDLVAMAELPVWPVATATATCQPAQVIHSEKKRSRREAGKQVPVGKVLEQQRTNRLVNEMTKQRERAKSQREQHRIRVEKEAMKKHQDQEKEKKTRSKLEQLEQRKREREQERQQKLKEKEKREAEERQRKMSRFEEKLQHRKQLTLPEKQALAEEFIVRSVKPLTFPKEFRFATEARSRSNKAKHEDQALALVKPTTTTTTAAPRVRATSRRGAVRGSSRTQGFGGPTKPVGFVFTTEARAARKRPYAVPVEAAAKSKEKATSARKRRKVDGVADAQQ